MFYVYLWLREDGTPYYVGKGTGRRGFTSVRHSVHRPRSRDNIITQDYATEPEAFAAEKFFIEFYGRIDLGTGCLRNLAEGGLGGSAAENGRYERTLRHRVILIRNMQGNKNGVGHGRPRGKHSTDEIAARSAGIKQAWASGKYAGRVRKFSNKTTI